MMEEGNPQLSGGSHDSLRSTEALTLKGLCLTLITAERAGGRGRLHSDIYLIRQRFNRRITSAHSLYNGLLLSIIKWTQQWRMPDLINFTVEGLFHRIVQYKDCLVFLAGKWLETSGWPLLETEHWAEWTLGLVQQGFSYILVELNGPYKRLFWIFKHRDVGQGGEKAAFHPDLLLIGFPALHDLLRISISPGNYRKQSWKFCQSFPG